MSNDLLHAARRLLATPASTTAGIVTLGLGLAAVMLVTAVARELVWRPSALPAAERVTLLGLELRAGAKVEALSSWSYPAYVAARETFAVAASAAPANVPSLQAVTLSPLMLTLAAGDAPQRIATEAVSAGYFDALGVAPALGRTLTASDDVRDAAGQQVWLGNALWRDAFGADPAVIGTTVTLEGRAFVVAGVLPAGFRGLSERAAAWVPMGATPAVTFPRRLDGKTSFWHQVFAVPATAAERAALDARLGGAARRVEETIALVFDGVPARVRIAPRAWAESRVDPTLRQATLAIGICALLLLGIVTGNLVLLMLARADARRVEMGVRLALGAPRARLVRTLVAELVLVFGAGLALALGTVELGLGVLARETELVVVGGQRLADVGLHGATLAVGALVALVALLAALAGPSRAVLALVPRLALARHAERVTGSGRRWLAGVQLGVATTLAIAATLAASAAWQAVRTPLGFEPAQVLTAQVSIPSAAPPADGVGGFVQRAHAALAALPGVASAGTGFCLPVRGGCDQVLFETVPKSAAAEWPVGLNMVGGDYFATLGLPLLEGRYLDARDTATSEPVVVLSAAAAAKYFPGRSPIGRFVNASVGWPEQPEGARIVGVVGDVLDARLEDGSLPMLYLPAAQFAYNENLLLVRAAPGVATTSLVPALRGALARIEPGLALFDVATMDERFDALTLRRRFAAGVIGALAALAVVLSLTGTFAVFDLIVRRRRRELGVRVALGASSARILRGVLGDALRTGTIAIVAGSIGGVIAVRVLASQLPGLGDDTTFHAALVGAAMLALALAATWWPARRAAHVDPMRVLRED